MNRQWKQADKDGKGQILFIEFVSWAFTQKLDLEDDDDADDFEVVGGSNLIATKTDYIKNLKMTSARKSVADIRQQKNDIWKSLKEKLPWRNNPDDKSKRDKYWSGFDVNGNGYLSLAEIDKGMADIVQIPVLFEAKPVLMRAYMAAKAISKAKSSHNDDYITKGEEFRYLFKYLRQYYEFFVAFKLIDNGQDQRVDKKEFLQATELLERWGIDTSDMDYHWKQADKDGKG